eukprot:Clim_evm50s109 gene=Clim_evmTU50s109
MGVKLFRYVKDSFSKAKRERERQSVLSSSSRNRSYGDISGEPTSAQSARSQHEQLYREEIHNEPKEKRVPETPGHFTTLEELSQRQSLPASSVKAREALYESQKREAAAKEFDQWLEGDPTQLGKGKPRRTKDIRSYTIAGSQFNLPARYRVMEDADSAYMTGRNCTAYDDITGERVFVKKTSWKPSNARDFEMLQSMQHDNLAEIKDVRKDEHGGGDDFYLIMAHMNCSLKEAIDAQILQPEHTKFIMYQIFQGLAYLHDRSVAHTDLTLNNILLDEDCNVKLTDFYHGLAADVLDNRPMQDTPESILIGRHHMARGPPADIFALGKIFSVLLTGQEMFRNRHAMRYITTLIETFGPPPKDGPLYTVCTDETKEFLDNASTNAPIFGRLDSLFQDVDPAAVELLSHMMAIDPSQRITAGEALLHEYFQDLFEADPQTDVQLFDSEGHVHDMKGGDWQLTLEEQQAINESEATAAAEAAAAAAAAVAAAQYHHHASHAMLVPSMEEHHGIVQGMAPPRSPHEHLYHHHDHDNEDSGVVASSLENSDQDMTTNHSSAMSQSTSRGSSRRKKSGVAFSANDSLISDVEILEHHTRTSTESGYHSQHSSLRSADEAPTVPDLQPPGHMHQRTVTLPAPDLPPMYTSLVSPRLKRDQTRFQSAKKMGHRRTRSNPITSSPTKLVFPPELKAQKQLEQHSMEKMHQKALEAAVGGVHPPSTVSTPLPMQQDLRRSTGLVVSIRQKT